MKELLFEERGRLQWSGLSVAYFILQKSNREVIDLSAELKKFQGEQVLISIERVRK